MNKQILIASLEQRKQELLNNRALASAVIATIDRQLAQLKGDTNGPARQN